MQDWTRVVRELYDCFHEKEERLSFLHELDRRIIDGNIKLEEICLFILENLVRLSSADAGYFYIESGSEFLLLCSAPQIENMLPIPIDDALDQKIRTSSMLERMGDGSFQIFPCAIPQCQTRTITPIKLSDNLWGVMCLESIRPIESSPLADKDLQEYQAIVAGQLEIAIQMRAQYEELTLLSKIQSELFTKELDIAESLESLIKNISFALNLGPFPVTPAPEIQILFYQEGDEYLTITATSGSEEVNTRIFVKESISGLLIEDPKLPFYLCDPRDYPEKYKSYLGKNKEGGTSKAIRTELVVPLRHDNKIIGIINLESELSNAFKVHHIQTMQRLAERVSPIVNALQKRIEKAQLQDKATIYAIKGFLNRFASTYKHAIYTPLHEASLELNLIKDKLQSEVKSSNDGYKFLINTLEDCLEAFKDIQRNHDRFSKGLPDFLNFHKYSINTLIQNAINDQNPNKLKGDDIEIIFNPTDDYEVYCSLFLQEHIYNILNNSAYSLRERKMSEPEHEGKIVLSTSLDVDNEERALNQRCRIRIVDNGTGAEKSSLSVIPNRFSTKPSGTGFGLSAAFQYLRSIGGRLEVDSEKGKFFEVNMYVDVYSDEVHGKGGLLSTISRKGV